MPAYGAIEAGGTKFVCAVGSSPDDLEISEIPATSPPETIARVVGFFRGRGIERLGIGSFGPVDLDIGSPTYGFITTTPKQDWRYFDLLGSLQRELNVETVFDTDVNAAALGEHRWGAARELHTFLYVTVGTGIGAGAMVDGTLMHGARHPEMGHVRIPHDNVKDPYTGCCPYHGDCLEGLACAPAINGRWGVGAEDLPDEHPAWDLEALYLALGIVSWACTLSPQRIILGGGVMQRQSVFPLIRGKVQRLLNGYFPAPEIVPPALGRRAGVLGALALAQKESS